MNTLEKIEAWMALCEVKARYCRLLDTKDWEGFANLLTEDIALDLSGTSSLGIINGRDAALKQIRSSIETAKTAHHVHTPEITFVSADEAQVIWAMQDRLLWSPDKPSVTGYGHYHERWIKRDGAWKLAAQKLTRLHMDLQPPNKSL